MNRKWIVFAALISGACQTVNINENNHLGSPDAGGGSGGSDTGGTDANSSGENTEGAATEPLISTGSVTDVGAVSDSGTVFAGSDDLPGSDTADTAEALTDSERPASSDTNSGAGTGSEVSGTDTEAATASATDTGTARFSPTETASATGIATASDTATDDTATDAVAIAAETETASFTTTETFTATATATASATASDIGPVDLCGNHQPDTGEECDDGNDQERDGCLSDCTVWFDSDFTRRTRLSIDNTGGEAVRDFPVLVTLDETSIDWSGVGDAGLCLVGDDHATLLAVEAEGWNPGSQSQLWVRVPVIEADDTTVIWLYYGNTTNTDGCRPSGSVWRDDFAGVWHLDGISDSSTHGHVVAEDGTVGTLDAPGAVGRGREMSDDGSLLGPSNEVLHITGDLTLSAWVSFDTLDDRNYDNAIVTYGEGNFTFDTNYAYGLYGHPDGFLYSYWAHGRDTTTVLRESDPAGLVTGTFFHVALVRDTATDVVRFYLNGEQIGGDISYPAPPDGGDDGVLMIGGNIAGDAYSMNGVLDELRISGRAVSSTWIALEHRSMTGALVTPEMDPPAPSQ